MPFTAPKIKSHEFLVLQLTFCCFQNVLEMPSGCIPTRLVKTSEANSYDDYGTYGSKIMKSIQSSEGLPIGIQVTGKHLEDQKCVGAMWQLEKLWGNLEKPKKWM